MEFNAKKALGFDKGYITIFQNSPDENDEYFRLSNARYCVLWGWYIVSTEPTPTDLPDGVAAIQLPWTAISNPSSGEMLPKDKVKEIVDTFLYPSSDSTFQGSIGERLSLTLTVIKSFSAGTAYGKNNTFHVFEDEFKNEYVWVTAAKNWAVGEIKKVRGTVKSHQKYKGNSQTILTRVMEVK